MSPVKLKFKIYLCGFNSYTYHLNVTKYLNNFFFKFKQQLTVICKYFLKNLIEFVLLIPFYTFNFV